MDSARGQCGGAVGGGPRWASSAATGGMQLCGAAALSSKHVQRALPRQSRIFTAPAKKRAV